MDKSTPPFFMTEKEFLEKLPYECTDKSACYDRFVYFMEQAIKQSLETVIHNARDTNQLTGVLDIEQLTVIDTYMAPLFRRR